MAKTTQREQCGGINPLLNTWKWGEKFTLEGFRDVEGVDDG